MYGKVSVNTSGGKMGFPSQLWSALFLFENIAPLNHVYRSICEPKPGQRLVKPGVIIMGYPGDPLCGARPAFTKDGSFMVFRKLEQNPMYLDHYTELNWKSIPAAPDPDQQVSLNEEQRKALFGARLFGRFKSVRRYTLHEVLVY